MPEGAPETATPATDHVSESTGSAALTETAIVAVIAVAIAMAAIFLKIFVIIMTSLHF